MNKKKKMSTGKIATIIGFVVLAVVIVILVINVIRGKNGQPNITDGMSGQDAAAEDEDVIPYGDEESASYDFTGDYFDMATQKGTMTITRDGSAYAINITYSESDDSVAIWKMTAAYDKNRRALTYHDCTRTDFIAGSSSDSSSGGDKYTDGSGFLYLSSGSVFWVDDKEDMGTGLLFQKTDEIGQNNDQTASPATDNSEAATGTGETTEEPAATGTEETTEEPAATETDETGEAQ